MKIVARYIGKSVIVATLVVLLVLVGLELFIGFVTELTSMGGGHYDLWQAIQYVLMTTPSSIYQLFPMIGLLGGMIGLGQLATRSELVVMRSSGVSLAQIIIAVMKAAVVLLIGAIIVGEVLGPQLNLSAQQSKMSSESSGQALATKKGVWLREGNNFIHVQTVVNRRELKGIMRYKFNADHELVSSSSADRATYRKGIWTVYNLSTSTFAPNKVTSSTQTTGQWKITLNPVLLNVGIATPQEMSLPKLWKAIQSRKANGLAVNRFQLSFWSRVFQPLATLVMIFLAIPFVFGSLRSITMGLRIMTGIFVGFGFYMANEFFGQLSVVWQWPPILGAIVPTLVFALLALLLMRRVT